MAYQPLRKLDSAKYWRLDFKFLIIIFFQYILHKNTSDFTF